MELNLKGHSGCQFRLNDEGNLVKYASGCNKRIEDLKISYAKTIIAQKQDLLSPFKIAKAISFYESCERFSFEMELISPAEYLDSKKARDLFYNRCFRYMSIERPIYTGFKAQCFMALELVKDGVMKESVINLLDECSDEYPESFCHGDFGLKNFLVKGGEVYTFDLSRSFINSVLHDIAMFKLSFIGIVNTFNASLLDMMLDKYSRYQKQIEIIKKIRVLEFYNETNTESTKILHRKMFDE